MDSDEVIEDTLMELLTFMPHEIHVTTSILELRYMIAQRKSMLSNANDLIQQVKELKRYRQNWIKLIVEMEYTINTWIGDYIRLMGKVAKAIENNKTIPYKLPEGVTLDDEKTRLNDRLCEWMITLSTSSRAMSVTLYTLKKLILKNDSKKVDDYINGIQEANKEI